MDLEEFVATSIEQVLNGVKRAQDKVEYGTVSPRLTIKAQQENLLATADYNASAFMLRFDVAVRATNEQSMGGGAKLKVASVLSVGGEGDRSSTDESVSRIQFEVPISYHLDATSNDEARDRAKRQREATAKANRRRRSHGPHFG
ncbi:MAG: hypothetical protein CMN27_11080 [Salinisphaera sp.]|nr:hypothetical protein [Salinisphaera sp.]